MPESQKPILVARKRPRTEASLTEDELNRLTSSVSTQIANIGKGYTKEIQRLKDEITRLQSRNREQLVSEMQSANRYHEEMIRRKFAESELQKARSEIEEAKKRMEELDRELVYAKAKMGRAKDALA